MLQYHSFNHSISMCTLPFRDIEVTRGWNSVPLWCQESVAAYLCVENLMNCIDNPSIAFDRRSLDGSHFSQSVLAARGVGPHQAAHLRTHDHAMHCNAYLLERLCQALSGCYQVKICQALSKEFFWRIMSKPGAWQGDEPFFRRNRIKMGQVPRAKSVGRRARLSS